MPSFTPNGYEIMKMPNSLHSTLLRNRNENDHISEDCQINPPVNNCMSIKTDGTLGRQEVHWVYIGSLTKNVLS